MLELHEAASCGNTSKVIELVERHNLSMSIDVKNKDDLRTPLFFAAANNKLDTLQYLLSKGAIPDLADAYGWTSIHVAAQKGFLDVLQELRKAGADPFVLNELQHTPLEEAKLSDLMDETVRGKVISLLNEWMIEFNAQTLLSQYKSFDKERIKKNLTLVYSKDRCFHFHYPKILRHIARKQGLQGEILQLIYDDFLKLALDTSGAQHLDFAQIIKYAVKHGAALTIEQLINGLKTGDDVVVQAELLHAITHKIKNEGIILEDTQQQVIQEFVKSNHHFLDNTIFDMPISDLETTIVSPSYKPTLSNLLSVPKVEIVKELHTNRATHIHKKIEQIDYDITPLLELLKNKTQSTQQSRQVAKMPTISELAGSDMQWFRTSYREVKNLYALANRTGTLKQDDKDSYLPGKFLSPNSKWFTGTPLCKFLIDRVICNIFANVSQKQKLHSHATSKLMLCVDTLDSFKQIVFSTNNNSEIVEKCIDDDVRQKTYQNEPDIIANFAAKLYSEGLVGHYESVKKKNKKNVIKKKIRFSYAPVEEKIISIVDNELNIMRVEALKAIYNSVEFDPSILSESDLKKIQERLCDSNREVKKYAFKIINVCEDNPKIEPSELLSSYLYQLENSQLSNEEVEMAINYFLKQLNKDQASFLITENHIARIISCISNSQSNTENRLGFFDVVFAYQASVGCVPLKELQSIVNLMKIAGEDELIEQCIRIVFQYTDKHKTLPSSLIDELLQVAKNSSSRASSLLVMVIAGLGATAFNYNELAFKLRDESVIIQEGNELVFVDPSKEHISQPSVAFILSKSILDTLSLNNPIAASEATLTELIARLYSADTKIKKISACILFTLLSKNLLPRSINKTELFDLQMATQDPISDVALYATLVYLDGLRVYANQASPLLTSHLDYLPKLYRIECFGSNSVFYEQVNSALFEVWSKEVQKKQLLKDNFFNLLEILLVSINGQEDASAHHFLKIVSDYISIDNHHLPERMIYLLENLLSTPGYGLQVQTMLLRMILNGQVVGQKSLSYLKDQLLKENESTEIIECLMLADLQQDLPEDVFTIVQMERAIACLEQDSTDRFAWHAIEEATERGSKLTKHGLNFLIQIDWFTPTLLSIYKNMVAIKQILTAEHLDLLFDQYLKNFSIRADLLTIFVGVEKNGQLLPNKIITYLEPFINDPAVMLIFLNKAQKGETLTADIIDKIIQFAAKGEWDIGSSQNLELAFKSALLNFIFQHVQKLKISGADYEAIFLRSISDPHFQIIDYGLQGLMYLQEQGDLSLSSLNQLGTIFDNCHDVRIKASIQALLLKPSLSDYKDLDFKLLTFGDLSDEDYLNLSEKLLNRQELFAINAKKIQQIILSKPHLQVRAFTILFSCIKPMELTVQQLTDLKKLIMGGEFCFSEVISQLRSKLDPSHSQPKLHENIQHWEDYHLSNLAVKFPTSTHSSRFYSTQDYDKENLLRLMLEKQISESVLAEYYRLFLRLVDTELQSVSPKLIHFFSSTQDQHLRLVILKLIILSCQRVPTCYQTFLEGLLADENPKFRSQAFLGLMYLPSMDLSPKFTELCSSLINKIEMNYQVRIVNLEYLQIIYSLNQCFFPIDMPERAWIKCLILSDWYALWQLNDVEKITLYEKWSVLEESLPNSDAVLTWLHTLHNLSHKQFLSIIQNILFLNDDITSLIAHPLTDFVLLRKIWLKRRIMQDYSEKPLSTIEPIILDDILQILARDLPIQLAEQWLPCFMDCNRVDEIRDFVQWVGQYKDSDLLICDVVDVKLDQLLHWLQIKVLSIPFMRLGQKHHLNDSLKKLLTIGWTFKQLEHLIGVARTKTNRFENDFLCCLKSLADYEISAQHFDHISNLMVKYVPSNWVLKLNELVIKESFSLVSIIKNPQQLVADLLKENKGNVWISGLAEQLLKDMQQIVSGQLPASNWSVEKIRNWASHVKTQPEYFLENAHLIEAITVARRALFILTGFQLTNTQILTCLLAFKEDRSTSKELGRLFQVDTSEGKTVIISIIAIIIVLQGKKVDVIKSNPAEAQRDVLEQREFYELFGISVADNLDRFSYFKGEKRCYRSDVVYGEMPQFQFDALRDKYALLETRGKRAYSAVIADEVDSMMIDDSNKIAKLSTPIAGIDQLRDVYYFISIKLKYFLEKIFITIDGLNYYFQGKVEISKDGRYELYYYDRDELIKIPDLRQFIQFSNVSCINGDPVNFIEKEIDQYLEELIAEGTLSIPEHFKALFAKQKSKWVKNTMAGFTAFHEFIHYIVQDNLVKPVAYTTNGVVQNSTQWNDGLQQSLQIKHHLAVSSESLASNFLSTWAYFDLYSVPVIGFSGTLGTPQARVYLKKHYHVQCFDVPSSRKKQYKPLPMIVMENQHAWMCEIYFETMLEVKKNRGVLIICKSICEVLSLQKFIKLNNRSALIKIYTMNGCDQEKAIKKIQPGEIFIATSIGGRGMDIKADSINHAGGIHVILASLLDPRNSKQALARTARQGKLGSGRYILNQNQLFELGYQLDDIKDFEVASERFERTQLDQLYGKSLELIKIKDSLFKKFCALLLEIRLDMQTKKNQGLVADVKDTLLSIFSNVKPDAYETGILAEIEERWSMLLLSIEDGTIAPESIETQYQAFEEQIRKEYKLQRLLHNPCHLIAIGNELLANANYEEAKKYYDQAIENDRQASAPAHVGLALIHLKKCDKNYKKLAIDELSSAIGLLCNELSRIQILQALMNTQNIPIDSKLMQQLTIRFNVLGSYVKSIDNAIENIKRSQRLMTLTRRQQYQNEIKTDKNYHAEHLSITTTYFELERTDGQLPLDLSCNDFYDLSFNHLTQHQDMGVRDQALQTIDAAFTAEEGEGEGNKKKYVLNDYRDISIQLPNVELNEVQEFLNPDIVRSQLSQNQAVQELETRISYLDKWTRGILSSSKVLVDIFSGETLITQSKELGIVDSLELVRTISADKKISLRFLKANKTISSLSTEFFYLNKSDAALRLSQINSSYVQLELIGKANVLLGILNSDPRLKDGSLVQYKKNSNREQLALSRKSLVSALLSKSEDELIVCFNFLKREHAQLILENCDEIRLNMSFHDIDLASSLAGLDSGLANLKFTHLNQNLSKELIRRLREKDHEFIISFTNLSFEKLNTVVRVANLEQQSINVVLKPLASLFLDEDKPGKELAELAARGIENFLEINERKPTPMRTCMTISLLGLLKIFIGSNLILSGYGAGLGLGIIGEGGADFARVALALKNRQFSWTDYQKQMLIAAIFHLPSIFQARGVLTSMASEESLAQAGETLISNGWSAGQKLVTNTKQLKVLLPKFIGVSLAEVGAREFLNNYADKLSNIAFERFKPQITELMRASTEVKFCNTPLSRLVAKLYVLDDLTNSSQFRKLIEHLVHEILNPTHSFWCQQWNSIGLPLVRGLLAAPDKLSSSASIGFRIISILQGVGEVQTIIDGLCNKLYQKLKRVDSERCSMPILFKQYCNTSEEEASAISAFLEKHNVICEQHVISINKLEDIDIDIDAYRLHQLKVKEFLISLDEKMSRIDTGRIISMIAKLMSEYIIQTLESKLLMPLSYYAVGQGVSLVSSKIQNKFIRSKLKQTNTQLEQKNSNVQETEFFGEVANETVRRLGDLSENRMLLASKQEMTFCSEILRISEKKVEAHSLCSIIHHASIRDDGIKQLSQQFQDIVSECVLKVREEGPADLSIMVKMAVNNDVSFRVVDADYFPTTQDKANNIQFAVFIPGGESQDGKAELGHWCTKDYAGNLVSIDSQGNDCGYAVMSHLISQSGKRKKTVAELRAETAISIETSPSFYYSLEAQHWLRFPNAESCNNRLFTGGRKEKIEDVILTLDEPDLSIINDTFNASQASYSCDCETIGQLKRIDFKKFSGFNTSVGVYRNNHNGNIVIAFQGTDFGRFESVLDTLPLAVGSEPLCAGHSEVTLKNFLSNLQDTYPSSKVVLTGHSKGAALASLLSEKYDLQAIVYDNPGIGGRHTFKKVLSIQSTPNQVNGRWFAYEGQVSFGTNGTSGSISNISSLKRGNVIDLKDSAGLCRRFGRWAFGFFVMDSHSLNHMGDLIRVNKTRIKEALRPFGYGVDAQKIEPRVEISEEERLLQREHRKRMNQERKQQKIEAKKQRAAGVQTESRRPELVQKFNNSFFSEVSESHDGISRIQPKIVIDLRAGSA